MHNYYKTPKYETGSSAVMLNLIKPIWTLSNLTFLTLTNFFIKCFNTFADFFSIAVAYSSRYVLQLTDFTNLDVYYKDTRTKLPPAPKFNIKQLWTEPKVTTPSLVSTTTASFKEPEVCAQDVVCLCLDVSGSMEVNGTAIFAGFNFEIFKFWID